jgi:hypothetical protein
MKRASYKRWSLTVLALAAASIALLMGVNFAIDPLQYYRKADYPPAFSTQQRYQNPGLARNYDYDTIIIGTSMTENFLPSYVNRKLGVKALKLSMSGATAKEQYMIAKLAIETGKVKRVIWGVDYFALRGEPDRVRDEFGPFPFYFYDKNPLNEWRYLLNLDTTLDSLRIIGANLGLRKHVTSSLELLNTWKGYSFGKNVVMSEWKKVMGGQPFVPSEYEYDNIKDNLDNNLIALIRDHKEIRFDLYYPPYSILQHRFFYEKGKALFDNELKTKRYLFEQVGALENVRIYDFQQEAKITFNLDNYKDLAHHSMAINEYIIDAIAADNYRVNRANLDVMLQALRKQVESVEADKL